MLSKSQIKIIKQLQQKKYRIQNALFIAEGIKTVGEFTANGFKIRSLFATADFINSIDAENKHEITRSELKKISSLKTPNKVLAVLEIPVQKSLKTSGLTVVLDEINDPGNLGTIIRLCDWFGVDQLVCSSNTVDCYNPKTVQASMGSLSRVDIVYTGIEAFLKREKRIVFGAFMEGENIYSRELPDEAVVVMGNEANVISDRVKELITSKISIPQFGKIQKTESLNVAMATAIIISEFKRKTL
jgi:TrmH family RNA methyltransferase